MKTAICALSLVAFAIAAWPYYERVMDRIEMERVVKDENILVKEYNHCFLDKTECTFFPGRIKKILKEAIVTACAKCSPKQKYNAKIYYETLIPKYPEEFKELSDKYDLNPFPHTKPYMASKV